MTDGERVREIRKAKAMTMREFGSCLGLGSSTISDIENGRRALTTQNRISICREFNVSEEWLCTGDGEMFVKRHQNDVLEERLRNIITDGNDSFRERLITCLLDLDAEQWEAVEAYAYRLVGDRTSRPAEDAESVAELKAQLTAAQSRIAELESQQETIGETEDTWDGKTREELHAELDRRLDEEKILSILEKMQEDISGLKAGQKSLEAGQTELKNQISEIDLRLRKVEITQENKVLPQIQLLAAAHDNLAKTAARRSDIEALREDLGLQKVRIDTIVEQIHS